MVHRAMKAKKAKKAKKANSISGKIPKKQATPEFAQLIISGVV